MPPGARTTGLATSSDDRAIAVDAEFLKSFLVMFFGAVCLATVVFFITDEGWRFGLLCCCVLPVAAAYLGTRGKREMRAGMVTARHTLAVATLPLAIVLASIEGT